MGTQKKLKEYLKKSVRKIRHRKGFGVHSPFAYNFITGVIDEKLPYYAYHRMVNLYKKCDLPFKVATLLFRVVNYFHSRNIVEIGCDGGLSILPCLVVDSRNHSYSLSTEEKATSAQHWLASFKGCAVRSSFMTEFQQIPTDEAYDMVILNEIPVGIDNETLIQWILSHTTENAVIYARGVRMGQKLESLWDDLCDSEDIQVTMDLYDYGLAMRRPRFFKQHYIVSF